jgi:ketosteroid isomerase-like protein
MSEVTAQPGLATAANRNLEIAREYLRAIEQGATGDALARFFAPDVVHQEFPNRLSPNGRRNGLAGMLEGAERGQKILAKQHYEIQHEVADGNRVALEVIWTGTMAVAAGTLAAGQEMRAHFAVFLQFRDGKIFAQRNYDCFDPW